MEYKTLGNTGLLVSTLCLGTMTFHGGSGFWSKIGTVDQAGADELMKSSLDAGINFSIRRMCTPRARARRRWGSR